MCAKVLVPVESEVRNLLKYALLVERQSEALKSPLMHLDGKIKVLMAAAYADIGLIKHLRRQEMLPEIRQSEDAVLDEYTL